MSNANTWPGDPYGISRQVFVWAWQSSPDAAAATAKLAGISGGLNRPCLSVARVLALVGTVRAEGVPLRRLRDRPPVRPADVPDLAAYAKEVEAAAAAGEAVPPPPAAAAQTPLAAPPRKAGGRERVIQTIRRLIAEGKL